MKKLMLAVLVVLSFSTNGFAAWYYGNISASNVLIASGTSSYAITLLKEDGNSVRLIIDPTLQADYKKAIFAASLTAVSTGARVGLSTSCPSGTGYWCQISVEK